MHTNSTILIALCMLIINILKQSHCLPCSYEIWLNETIAAGEDIYDFQNCTLNLTTCPENSALTMACHDLTDPPLFPLGVSGNFSLVALKALDREEKDLYTLKCLLKANDTQCHTFDFVIHINDVNDNAPMFTQSTYTISVFETASAFSNTVKISEASIVSDVDSDPYAKFVVELLNSSLQTQNEFTLETVDDLTGIYLIQNALPLDRELQSFYNLTLLAKDVLDDSLSSTAQLIIEIGDLNDNGPMILDDIVIITIPEDTEPGAEVGYVAVEDLDVYPNNQMNFYLNTICTYGKSTIDTLLILNNETGVFTLNGTVDAEGKVYSLDAFVVVIDPTVVNRFDCAPIRVNVSDVNDNTPEISVTLITESVEEGSDNNLEIVRFVITDRDSLENGMVGMDFSCGNAFECSEYFRLERSPPLFNFVMQQPLDYELTSQVDVIFEYFDNGTIRNTGTYELTLLVIPVNEFPPEFPSYEISCLVGEDIRSEGYICEGASATDRDAGIDGDIIYSIIEETALPSIDVINQNFMFDTVANSLVLLKEFDFETLSSNETNFFFKINASNYDGLHSIAEISIKFIDVNDNAPYIEPIASSFEISEDKPRGYKVVALQTGDLDSGENGRVTVSLLSADLVPFVVEYSEEGWVLVTKAILDREFQSSYNLALVATDHGEPPLNSTIQHFSVTLLDVNDNRPYFENSMYTFTLIMANDTWGIPVIDRDSEIITKIRLDFGDNIELGRALYVDELTRHIILNNPSAITEGSYEFTIYVHDPSLSSEETSTRCTFLYKPWVAPTVEDTSLAPIIAGIGLSILLILILLVTMLIFCLIVFTLRQRTHRVRYHPQVRRRKNPSLLPASILKPSSRLSEGKKKVSFNSNVHLMTFSPHKGSSSETSYTTSDISNEDNGSQWPNNANREVPSYNSRIIEDPESWIPASQQPYHQNRRQDFFTNSTSSECLDTKDSNAPLIEPNHVYYQNTQEVMISNRYARNNMADTRQVQVDYANCYNNQVTSSEGSDVMGENVLYNPMHDGMDSENSDESERPPYGAVPLYISSDMTSEGDLSTGVYSDHDTNISNQADCCMTNIPSDSYDGEFTV